MTIRFHRLIAVSTLLLAGAAAQAQSLYPVRSFSLAWDMSTKQGTVRINADYDKQPEEVIVVPTIAELNSWGHFLKDNDVQVRVNGSQRVFIATKKR